jgi:hypothetical protein
VPGKCGRLLRGSDPPRYCTQPPAVGRNACRLHGGATPAGIGHYNLKGGRFSKCMPKGGLKKAYDRAAKDPELVSLRDDLAALEARQVQLLESLGNSPPPPWEEAAGMMREFRAAMEAKDVSRMQTVLHRLESLVRQGASAAKAQARVWREMRALVAQKTRTAAACWARAPAGSRATPRRLACTRSSIGTKTSSS